MPPPQSGERPWIQAMRREDLDEIMEIERSAHRSPWAPEVFIEELHRGWAHVDVLREPASGDLPRGRILGYVNYWLVGDEVHVLNVATHPGIRRSGHASRLLEHVARFARAHGCRFVSLEVRRRNRAALRLYRRHGYRPVGLRPHYYEDGEDAVVMLLDLEKAR